MTHDPLTRVGGAAQSGTSETTPDTWAEKFESFERINSIRATNENFDSCNLCTRLVLSRLHKLHESKFSFVTRIEFIRSKLSNFSARVSGVTNDRHRPAVSVRTADWITYGCGGPGAGSCIICHSSRRREVASLSGGAGWLGVWSARLVSVS